MRHPRPGGSTSNSEPVLRHWYSVVESRVGDRPVLEILQSGRPLYVMQEGHRHPIRIGAREAVMLLACLREIRVFYGSHGTLPLTPEPLVVQSRLWQCKCSLVRHDGFEWHGKWQAEPWLEIGSGHERVNVGIGMAEAVLFLEAEIEHFVFRAS